MGTHPIFESDFDCLTDFRTLGKMTDLSIVDDEDASYLDIDDILMTEDKIGCKAKYDLLQVDFRRTQEDVSASKTIDLPVWLALRMNEFVRHEIPKQYRTRFQNILNADSEVVNLHKEGPRYYALGLQLANDYFDCADDEDVIRLFDTLSKTLTKRMIWIADQASADHFQISKIDNKLDDLEKELFTLGIAARSEWRDWSLGRSNKLTESAIVTKTRKRKRDAPLPMSQ